MKSGGFRVGLVMFMDRDMGHEARRIFAKREVAEFLAYVGRDWLDIEMPCGHAYQFTGANLPTTNTLCGCGDKKHIVVLWRMHTRETN